MVWVLGTRYRAGTWMMAVPNGKGNPRHFDSRVTRYILSRIKRIQFGHLNNVRYFFRQSFNNRLYCRNIRAYGIHGWSLVSSTRKSKQFRYKSINTIRTYNHKRVCIITWSIIRLGQSVSQSLLFTIFNVGFNVFQLTCYLACRGKRWQTFKLCQLVGSDCNNSIPPGEWYFNFVPGWLD